MPDKPEERNDMAALSPSRRARRVIGRGRLAQLCGLSEGAVQKWDRAMSKGGLGGLIPSRFQARILTEAKMQGLPLSAEDLIAEPVL